ncbi:hypothetical protein HAZT_HAZT005594, partial [Hyalella azteca]
MIIWIKWVFQSFTDGSVRDIQPLVRLSETIRLIP